MRRDAATQRALGVRDARGRLPTVEGPYTLQQMIDERTDGGRLLVDHAFKMAGLTSDVCDYPPAVRERMTRFLMERRFPVAQEVRLTGEVRHSGSVAVASALDLSRLSEAALEALERARRLIDEESIEDAEIVDD